MAMTNILLELPRLYTIEQFKLPIDTINLHLASPLSVTFLCLLKIAQGALDVSDLLIVTPSELTGHATLVHKSSRVCGCDGSSI